MADLTGPKKLVSKARPRPTHYSKPVKDATKIYEGAIVAIDPATGKAEGASATSSLHVYGVARHTADNSGTLTPTPEVIIDHGVYLMTVNASVGLADEGKPLYVVDNQTLSLDSSGGTRPFGGILEEVDPDSATRAFVSINPPGADALAGGSVAAGADLTDAAATIEITEGAWRKLPDSTLTANRVLTLGTTGAKAGDTILITRVDAEAFTYTIANGGTGAGNVAVLPASEQGFVEAHFDGTDWGLYRGGAI